MTYQRNIGTNPCRTLRLGVGRTHLRQSADLHQVSLFEKARLSNGHLHFSSTFRHKIEDAFRPSVRGATCSMGAPCFPQLHRETSSWPFQQINGDLGPDNSEALYQGAAKKIEDADHCSEELARSIRTASHQVSPCETGALRREFPGQRRASRCAVACGGRIYFLPPPLLPLRPGPYCIAQKCLRLSGVRLYRMQEGSGVLA